MCEIVTDDCTGGGNPTTTMHFRLENMQTKTGGQQLTSLPSSSLKLDSRSSWTQCSTLEFLPHLSRDLPTIYPLQLAQRQNSSKNWYFSCENQIEENQTLCMKWAVKPVKKPSGALKELLPCLNKNFSPQTFGPLQTFSTSFILYTTKIVKIWITYYLLNSMIF